jgi:predicted DNA-binding transcriptional regulator AlpA
MSEHEHSDAITESELARRTKLSTSALRKGRREKKGPRFLRLGRVIRYLARDVDAWLEKNAVGEDRHR